MSDVQQLHIKHSVTLEVPMQRKIGIDIHRLDNRIRRCVQHTATQHEMEAVSGTNGRIIRFLSEHTDRDIYQKDLESEFGITRSTASRVLRLMEQKGLVERQSVPQDARLKKLVLTPKALAVHEGVISRIRATEARITKDVTPEELEQFFAITAKFRRNLE